MAEHPKLTAALAFFADGYSPWPVVPGDKMPMRVNGRTWGGRRHEPLTDAEIRKTWGGRNPPDIGLVIREGHFVIDLDPKNNPAVTAMFDDLLAVTRCAHTPSGGLHAYFSCTGKHPVERPALGVDVQGFGAFVVAPPSRDRRWANDLPEAFR